MLLQSGIVRVPVYPIYKGWQSRYWRGFVPFTDITVSSNHIVNTMDRINWFDRKFDFSTDQNILPTLIERLEGTPVRLAEKLRKIEAERHKVKPDNKWSILEHAGHLSDLEPLWQGRLDDILKGEQEMRLTDLTNRQTDEANHNEQSPRDLLDNFSILRAATINSLRKLNDEDVFRSALHPRLKTPMRVIDLFLFVAEHDDHHLAAITALATP